MRYANFCLKSTFLAITFLSCVEVVVWKFIAWCREKYREIFLENIGRLILYEGQVSQFNPYYSSVN